MTVVLKSNFLTNARGFSLLDGGGATWAINPATNAITITVGSAGTATTAANLAGGAAGSLPYQTAAGATQMLPVGSTGQLLTISGGLPGWEPTPTWNQNTTGSSASCTGNALTATNVAYSGLTGSVPTWNQNTSGTAAGLSATLVVASGGTGQTSAAAAFNALSPMTTKGDIIYDSAAATASRLAVGSTGQVLTVAGGVPTWAPATTVPVSANPSGTIGLTVINGTALTWMTSDSTPALSQAIVPTWTGGHLFNAGTAVAFAGITTSVGITGLSNTNALVVLGTDIAAMALQSSAATNRTAITFRQSSTVTGKIGCDGTQAIFTDSTNGDVCIGAASGAAVRFGVFGGATVLKLVAAGMTVPTAVLTAAAPTVGAGQIGFGGTTSITSITTAGGLTLPLLAAGYIVVNVAGTNFNIPYFTQ